MTWKLLRGRVVIREDKNADVSKFSHIIVPDRAPDDKRWHVGTVIGLGAPALTDSGAEVPYGFGVGDRVYYHFIHNEKYFTREWEDGKLATWVPQNCVTAVVCYE